MSKKPSELGWGTAPEIIKLIDAPLPKGEGYGGRGRYRRKPTEKVLDFLEDNDLIELLPYLTPTQRKELDQLLIARDPVLWLERNFMIPEPRDPMTGAFLADDGPIKIAPYQAKILREALRRDDKGNFVYTTVLWSEPKKTGKTSIAAGIALYIAYTQRNSEIYCVANDGKQAKDKIYAKVRRCIELSGKLGGIFKGIKPTRDRVDLPNGSFIEAISCDPSGEAGGEPTLSVFSELQGFRQTHKTRLWAELTVPPTKWGRALRWAESYAGYSGEDSILEQLHDTHVANGEPHPDFPDLPVYASATGKTLAFWSHEGRHAWHTSEYYLQEEENLPGNEFRRMHKNEWVSPEEGFVDPLWWDACRGTVPSLDDDSLIVAVDAAVSDDSFAVVGVSRHPDESKADDQVVVRLCRIWKAPKGGKIDYLGTDLVPGPEKYLRWLIENYSVLEVDYDAYQLHDMMSRLKREGLVKIREFSQSGERLEADSQLRKLIMHRRLTHDGNSVLTQHIANSMAKTDTEERKLRIVKASRKNKIDAAVALSMSAHRCLELNL